MNTLSQKNVIKMFNKIHKGFYSYEHFVYISAKTKSYVTCPIHGDFLCNSNNHQNGKGCPKCKFERLPQCQPKSQDQCIKDFKKIHGDTYGYENILYINDRTEISITCKFFNHGDFWQTPNSHLRGQGCPKCKSSKAELIIERWLKENHINYISQYRIKDCRDIRTLPFDFAIFNTDGILLCLIEFDGEQHHRKDSFYYNKKIIKHDRIKTQYCLKNNIKLIRIFKNNDIYPSLKRLTK